MELLKIVQENPVVGDIDGNSAIVEKYWQQEVDERDRQADLLVFSEFFLTGYPPEDLVLKPVFIRRAMDVAKRLAAQCAGGPGIIVGCPWAEDGRVYNAVLLLDEGVITAVRFKRQLPNYGVFDEMRVFACGKLPEPVDFRGTRIGLPVCEDIWKSEVCRALADAGAQILISINGSPFDVTKMTRRSEAVMARVAETGLPIVYVNQVGGQDELVFDGSSFVMNADGSVPVRLNSFMTDSRTVSWFTGKKGLEFKKDRVEPEPDRLESTYRAMTLGLKDYIQKNRFPGVVLGLSGGVDSALTAAVAVDALGPERVYAVMLPYRYTSSTSLEDAEATAGFLKIRYDVVPIEPAVDALSSMLGPMFAGTKADITEENIQSRVRGVVLMAISNKFGNMVVTTGNKSESSVGYATIYGDMCGGYSVLKDIYKTDVFALCHWRNENIFPGALGPHGRVMPDRTITRPPSAELRPGQEDRDSLPPYDQLDEILENLVEGEKSRDEICAGGHDPDMVAKVEHLLYISEYKRRQSAPGVKISSRKFGRDRRYPLTNRFRDMKK